MKTVHAQSLVGVADQQHWSQAQKINTESETIVLVLSLYKTDDENALDLASIGSVVFEKFHEQKEKLTTTGEWSRWIKSEIEDLKSAGLRVSTIIAIISEESLWLWGEGIVSGLVYRAGKIARLVGEQGFGEGVAGKVMRDDIFVLGTSTAIEFILRNSVTEIFEKSGDIGEYLAPGFYAQDQAADQALVVLQLGEEEQGIVQEKKIFKFPAIRIVRMSEEPRKFNLVFGGVLVGLLTLLVLVGIVSRSRRMTEEAYQVASGRAQSMLVDAEQVAETNPERAKILLSQSKEVLTQYLETEPKATYIQRAEAQLREITAKTSEILKVRGIELKPTIELAILSEGLRAGSMQSDNKGSLYFWNDSKKEIVGVNVADLSTMQFPVEGERFVTPFTVFDEIYTGMASSGVWQGSKKEQKVVIPTDETWGSITQVATFGNNIYLLDTGMGEIWKYAATENGYAERRRWLGAGIVLDLSKVVDWVVDGDVWLLTSSGKLERYSRGVPTKFALTGFPSEREAGGFIEPVAMTISNDTVYVLEKGARRVVAFKENGAYLEQYVSEDFGMASDITVYDGKGYVLVGDVIKEWEL